MAAKSTIRVTQTKSAIGRKSDQRQTLIGLGLNKIGRVRELENELIAIVAGTRINDNLEYTADPLLVTFSRHFCDAVASNRHSASRSQIWGGGKNATPLGIASSSIGRWCMRVLYTCVATDQPTALPLYIQLHYSALVFSLTRQPRQWLSLCAVIK